ncbi:MAG: hypothetical protein GEU82_05505 [Luteitalea sp.]|nr:hypothetical protein [Luteitalea sp.]
MSNRSRMPKTASTGAFLLLLMAAHGAGQTDTRANPGPAAAPGKAWILPRTADGQPDLQGVWDMRSATPLERPDEYAGRPFLTDEEAAAFEQRAAERPDGRPPGDPRVTPSVHPVWWLDYGRKVVGTKRTSLIVDPPDGKIPPLAAEGRQRLADRRAAAASSGGADSWEDRSLWERCITRGLPEGMLPGPYNSNLQILQTPDQVVMLTEMIHDARIVAIDLRPHVSGGVRQWLGDSRGWWEGETLVVETKNFSARANYRGSAGNLHLVERFSRTDAATLDYQVTLSDPTTWTKPWTIGFPMVKTDGRVYEYACHEGNYGLRNMLSVARASERSPAEDAARKRD